MKNLRRVALPIFFLICSFTSFAQNGTEAYKPLIGPNTTASSIQGGVVIIGSGPFSPLANITDGNKTNFASNTTLVGLFSADGISVKSTTTFASGWRAGFVVQIDGALLDATVLSNLTISTYNNNVFVGSASGANTSVTALANSSTGKLYLNFASPGAFNEVRVTYFGTVGVSTGNIKVYYAMAFDPDAGLNENNGICDDQIAGAGTNVSYNGGLLTALFVTTLTNPNLIVDGDKNTSGTLTLPAGTGLLTTPIYVGVTDLVNVYPSGNKAGFVIRANSSLLSAAVLNNIKVQTYLFGDFQEEASYGSGSGLLNLSALSSSSTDKKRLEFTTTKKFNEVRLVFAAGIDVVAATTDIFYAYESGSSCTDCSVGIYSDGPSPNGSIDVANTGLQGLCVGGTFVSANAPEVVTSSQADFTAIGTTIAIITCTGRVSVSTTSLITAGAGTGTFAGFEIAQDNGGLFGLLSLSVLNSITVSAFNGATPMGSATGASLLNGGVLAGTGGKTLVGFKPTGNFNRIRIDINLGLLAIVAKYRVYRALIILDTDGDGTPDCIDQCAGSDAIDADGDGIPDACDPCSSNTGVVTPLLSASSLNNVCPVANADLTTITASNTPGGATLTWHTGTPATDGNLVATPASVGAGIYYGAFGFGANCYSGSGNATAAVTVSIISCLSASNPAPQTAYPTEPKSGNAATELSPTGGTAPYTYSNATGGGSCTPAGGATQLPGGSNLTVDPSGTYTYTAPATPGLYYFCIQICDGSTPQQCVTKTYTLTVTSPVAPKAEVDNNGTPQNVAVTGNLSSNDSDPQNFALTYNTTPVQAPAHGGVTINTNGTYTYTPTPGYVGIDSFMYEVCNTVPLCSTQKAYMSVSSRNAGNDAPIAADDYPGTNLNTPISSTVAANDIDPEGNALTFSLSGVAQNGSISMNPDGTFTYTPNNGFTGIDSIPYQVCDNGSPSKCDIGKVYITVDPNSNGVANDPPVAVNDIVKTNPGVTASGNVGNNDTDPNGDALSFSLTGSPPSGLIFNSNGSYNYTPANNFTGTVNVSYQVCDNGSPSKCDIATLTLVSASTLVPDLTPTFTFIQNAFTSSNTSENFVANLFEILNATTSGQITFTVLLPPSYTLSYNPSLTQMAVKSAGTINVDNTLWDLTLVSGQNYTFKSHTVPPVSITGLGSAKIGLTLTRNAPFSNSTGNVTITIAGDPTSQYDSNPYNNSVTRIVTTH